MRVKERAGRSLALACSLALISISQSHGQQAPEAKPPAAAAKPMVAEAPTYVGSETCQACHEDLFNAIKKSPHGVVESDKDAAGRAKPANPATDPGARTLNRDPPN
jgi:hypothetical protein